MGGMRRAITWCVFSLACSGPPAVAPDVGPDATAVDATVELPPLTVGSSSADFDCTPVLATGGTAASIDVELVPFPGPDAIPLAAACALEPSAAPGMRCSACTTLPAMPTRATLMLVPGTPTALCLGGDADYLPAFASRAIVPDPGGLIQLQTLQRDVLATIATGILGAPLHEGTSVLAGVVRDCTGNAVRGAEVRIFDETAGTARTSATDPDLVFAYVAGETADPSMHFTSSDGIFGIANVVVDRGPVRVETWGVPSEGMPPRRLGCEVVPVHAGYFDQLDVIPQRGDYEPGSPCDR